ncbi:hypothetical protein BDZ89DRAFT_1134576 [Hymenopellis radicata]|nr:hypothetical protein BDZ89DRAFT_1134576 [Hymenopellis radicata]
MKTLVWHEGYFKRTHLLNWPMILATITLLVFATLNASLSVRLNLEGFIYYRGDPSDWFNNMGSTIAIIKRADYVGQTFMGDCILIYRCWVIHGRKAVVIFFPTLFLIAETVCGVMTVYTQAHLDPNEDVDSQLTPYLMTVVSSSGYAVLDRHPGTLLRVKVMMIESGLLYTVTTLIFFGMYVSSNNASSLMQDTIVQIIGITFNLIIVSVSRNAPAKARSSRMIVAPRISLQSGNSIGRPDSVHATSDKARSWEMSSYATGGIIGEAK